MANQRFSVQFDFEANIGPVKTAVADLQKSLSNIHLPANMAVNFEKMFGKLESEITNFQALTKNGFSNMADVNKAQTAFARISKLLSQLGIEAGKIKGIDPNKLIPKEISDKIDSVKKKWRELNDQSKKKSGFEEQIKKQNEILKEQKAEIEGLIKRRKALGNENKVLGAAKSDEGKKKDAAESQKKKVLSDMAALEGQKGGKSTAQYANLKQELGQLNAVIKACDSEMARLTSQINRNKSTMGSLDGQINQAQTSYDALKAKIAEMQNIQISPQGLLELRQELAKLLGLNLDQIPENLSEIEAKINGFQTSKITQINNNLERTAADFKNVENTANGASRGVRNLVDTAHGFNRAAQDVENLKNQVYYFFSLTNSVQLFKRAIRGALDTVKELDATMTEAAVVTDFSVGDMWDKLPEYSANAQKLGVSINGMYQATTLYYQQGLKSNEAMALGIETMKMARIAGMESAEATEAMTAALRGFNMELNEASATRVNDVYSQLAAVTAADTEQIATAMSKTASIAASANMEFETTAALLAQIIETTQEAPETAGTALKTIIARFSEVKSLQNEGKTSGTDAEGETIDVNKIQTALKTVGISMDGFFQGTEGLDSILLKLAEKWNTLDFQTQHYIATMAAGSRQQSRFIAMMSDYERTTELVGEAQNSAGASQRQFNKTQDSMESKLQRLENAWNEFLMGLSNNEVLKGAIDILTFIIEGVNNLTEALSGGNGLVKSVMSLITVIGALKLGKSLLGSGLGFVGNAMGLTGMTNTGKISGKQNAVQQMTGPNVWQQGEIEGQKAAAGFKAGWSRTMETGRNSGGFVARTKSFFTSDAIRNEINARKANNAEIIAGKGIQKRAVTAEKTKAGSGKMSAMKEIAKNNIPQFDGDGKQIGGLNLKQLSQVKAEYDKVYQATGNVATATEAANGKVRELGGTLMNTGEQAQLAGEQTKTVGFDFQALGGVVMGVGAALGGLAMLFESLGMEEAAEATSQLSAVFMGLGVVMSVMPGIAKALGMSFTKAGIQISIAGWSGQMAWAWVIAIVAIVALLVAGVIALAKAWEEASDAAQLEKMNEQLADLSAAADEAKQKLEDMASAKEDLEDMQSTFEGLVKGSREWKQALIENNQKLLELINTYPQLAEYVSKGINGELIISEKGWNEVMDQQQEVYTHTLGAKTATVQQIQEKEQLIKTEETMNEVTGNSVRMDYAKFAESDWGKIAISSGTTAMTAILGIIDPGIASIGPMAGTIQTLAAKSPEEIEREQTGGLTYDEFNEFAALAAERGYSMAGGNLDRDAAESLLSELGYDVDVENMDAFMSNLDSMGIAFDDLANSAMAVSMAEQTRADSIAASVAQTSTIVQDSEEFGIVAEEMGAQAFTKYDDKVAEKADSYLEDMDTKDLESGEAAEVITKYAKIQGISEAEVRRQIENEEITKEDIANIIAAQDVNEEMKKAMEGTVRVLDEISMGKSDREMAEIKGLMSDHGMGMGISSIQNMPTTQEDMVEYLESQGFDKEDAEAMGYESMEALAQGMLTNAKNAQAAFDNAFNIDNTFNMGQQFKVQINSLNDSLLQLGSTTGLTVGQTQMLANSLARVTANGGDAAALLRQFPNLLQGLSGKDLDNAINLLATTDWTTQDGIESTIAALESLGVTVEDHMVEQLYIATQAVKKFDLSAMEEKLSNLQSLIDKVTEKANEGSKSFTKEERDALVAGGFGEDMFVRIGIDEYAFMGTTESLLASIENYVSEILGKMRGDVDEAVTKGEGFDEVFQNDGKTYVVGDGTEGSITGKEMTGEQIIQRLATGELDTLGVGGTNNVGRGTLEQLVEDTGILDGIDWSDYTDYMLAEALIQGYTNYYGPGGMKYKQNKEAQNQINSETLSIEYAQAVGTREFYDLYAQGQERQATVEELSGFEVTRDAEGWEFGAFSQSGRDKYTDIGGSVTAYTMSTDANGYATYQQQTDFDPQQLLYAVATQEGFAENYQYDSTVLAGMRNLGIQLGISGVEGMDFATLQQELTAYYDSMSRGDEVLDALIASETGLDLVLEQANEELSTQTIDCEKNSAMVKQLVLTSNQANKSIDKLNDVLEEQGDILKNANKESDAYKKSLSLVTNAAKEVFGEHIDAEFVEKNIGLFEDLAKGGEVAAAAWKALSEKSGQAFLGTLNLTEEQLSGIEAQMAALDGMNLEIGGSANFSDIFTQLANIMGSAAAAEAYIESLGGYEVEWVPNGTTTNALTNEEMPNYIAIVKKTDETGTGSNPSTGGGGGGGGDKWENPYDKLHNVLEEINDLLREREKLERRYQRLVDQGTVSAEKLSKISNDNISNYQDEIAKQEYVIAGRKAQVQAKIKANPDMEKYVYTDVDAMGNETIRINWDAINGITDSEEGEKVSEFYDDIDEWLESIYDAEESILDAEDGIWEELQQGKDEYLDLEEQVKEAIVNERQEEIDKLSAINDSINDTNSRLLEAMQSSIDKYRQDRENQKTEEELSDKQRRLAYLQQDTSGANNLEIMKLQEEIDQGQQDYTDSLIDQKISELQEQNDKAAEQRQQQIDIMQAQLDKYVESGEIWKEVSDLITTGTDAAQNLVKGSELETLLKSSAGFEGMSNVQKMAWLQDTNVLIAQALKWLSDGAVSTFSTGQEVTFKTGDGKTITGKANAQGEVEADGQIYKDVSMDAYGNYSTKETVEDAKNEYAHRAEEKKKAEEEAAFNARFPYGRPSDISRNLWRGHSGTDVKALQQALNELGFNAGEVDGIFDGQTWNALAKFKDKYGGHGEYGMQSKTKAAFKAIEYKTGGLADFTGPAWLDGTRSKPEYILNADQTKAFFTLIDVLGSLQAGNSKTAQNSGDNTYDIDINVESIGSDYDVEQLATTVKRLINEDARYRNNNAINLMR